MSRPLPNWKPVKTKPDTRYVYGACTWHDTIYHAGRTRPLLMRDGKQSVMLPCCPHCGSVLLEVPTEDVWWEAVRKFESEGHPGYEKVARWLQGRECFKTMADGIVAYNAEHPLEPYAA